jgi:potassium-transporting ATPase potassium-binding subunit
MVGDVRQGYAVVATMAILYIGLTTAMTAFELQGAGTAPQLAGGAMEGKEMRFGIPGSTLYASSTTLTSTGSVNSMHDSYTSLGGGTALVNMMLGETAPGGVGSGLYGMLVLAIIAVFVAGLMVGRTPEYLGKKIGPREIKLVSLYILATPVLVLLGTALSFAIPAIRADVEGTSIWNPGLHGFSEVLYAFTSAANNNGSAFAGLTANTPWFTTALGVAMLLGRFLPIVFVLALAGSFAAQDKLPVTAGTLPTHRPQFVGLHLGAVLVVSALTYFPVLALGPLAEGLS